MTKAKGYLTYEINGGGHNMYTADDICKTIKVLTKFWVVVLLSHMEDYLIPRRMQFTASLYLLSFQSYKGLKMARSA